MKKFELNELLKNQLIKSAKWGKFLSFFGFFISGLSLLNILMAVARNPSSPLFILLIFYITMLFPCFYLYQFSKNINDNIDLNNLNELEFAFENLAKFFHFIAIFVIIIITLFIFQIIAMY